MKIRLLSVRRTFHVPVTNRVGIAAAVALGAVGVVAGGYGIASSGQERDSSPHTSIGLPDTEASAVPPTMVRITTSTSATPSARVVVNDEPELGAVLRGLFAAASVASGPVVDPDYFGLAVYATGDALDEIRETLSERRDAGIARRPSTSGPASSVHLTGASIGAVAATATACQVDSDELYDLKTGEVLDNTVLIRSLHIDFAKMANGWKVSTVKVEDFDSAVACTPGR
jgi:hypothetical protein